ncbi:MAG TPA: DNA polymerase II large subunit [Thermoplasmata archaeon]|nr:DNA polymerase II large subunit [Thermoplasmata archaeon]
MDEYFRSIESEVDRVYERGEEARRTGIDPQTRTEIPRAQDMASRVEKLLQHLPVQGIAAEIRTLAETEPREEVALRIARRLAADPTRGETLEARLDCALRVGLAILTEGILVAPLEGLAEVHIRSDGGGPGYVELYYAGPIRAAGGTAQALSVLLADVVRRDLGIGAYVAQEGEVGRYQEEIPLYKHLQHLQYVPNAREIELIVRHIPVAISGESTEGDAEVSAFRNLPRVPTNGIRGGACLVIAEGVCLKAPKIRKIVDRLGVPGWEFLARIGQTKSSESGPSAPKYLAEALGGRPILAYPGKPGGFRLAYGRARTAGLAACAINPATMVLLRHFVAIGTQLKLEYPGKASAMALCDTIEGPIVALEDGSVCAVDDVEHAEAVAGRVVRILDLGQILVPFGEFLENNRALLPGAYTLDWHREELAAAGFPPSVDDVTPEYPEAVRICREYRVPLHPRFLLFWHDVSPREVRALAERVEESGLWIDGRLRLTADAEVRALLGRLGVLFSAEAEGTIAVDPVSGAGLVGGLGLVPEGTRLQRAAPLDPVPEDPLEYVSRLAGVLVRARAPSRVGARVGRPEKARQRKMSPNVHALFPLGDAGGPPRSLAAAARSTVGRGVLVGLGVRRCAGCGKSTVWPRCACGAHTEPTGHVINEPFPVAALWAQALDRLTVRKAPEVKGVKGLTSPGKVPELLEKGVLRAQHGISVYQDGTARFDLTDVPLTHFRLREIGLTVAEAQRLGYDRDYRGAPITDPEQLIELKPQDLILATAAGKYLLALAHFVDDELVRLYHVEPYYRAHRIEDLRGQIVVALAPHTSGGVAGRILGFTAAEGCFAHPVFHAAKRRNCDGDEDSVTLLLDALLNFSRSYLPESRGALMDKPLVLTTRLDVEEVDKEAHSLDIVDRYPLAFWHAAAAGRPSKEVEPLVETVARRVGSAHPLDGYGFTHDTSDIAGGPVLSAYREAGSMERIVERSLALTMQLRSVDIAEAVTLVLNAHFLPDLMGNLKSYATQHFRCRGCEAEYRRPPLSGRCSTVKNGVPCPGEISPTVFEGAVRKYLGLSQRLAGIDGVTPYLRQRVELLEASLLTMFPGTAAQTTLENFAPRTSAREPPTAVP